MIRKAVITILCLAALQSCQVYVTPPPPKPCPEPPPTCWPGKAGGTPIDTVSLEADKKPYYYKISLAQGINSRNNEYAVAFDGERRAILTYAERGAQSIALFDRLSPRDFVSSNSIASSEPGHIGFPAVGKGELFYSYSENLITGIHKTDTIWALTPLNRMIGISRIAKAKYNGGNSLNAREPIEIEGSEVFDWISQPTPAGNYVIFSTDMPGGYGGTDLWAVPVKGGKPINLGPEINSGCDELTPFLSPDGSRIYFSSAGHETYGGYDVFYSEIQPLFWTDATRGALIENSDYFTDAVNCGFPLNTKFDEMSPSCPAGDCDSLLYYASNQEGTNLSLVSKVGEFDIFYKLKLSIKTEPVIAYRDSIKKPINPKLLKPRAERDTFAVAETYSLEGVIYNERTRLPLPGVKIVAKPIFAEDTLRVVYSDKEGKYSVDLRKGIEYDVTAEGRDVFYRTQKVFVPRNDVGKLLVLNFSLPEVMTLRINFPTDVYDEPYRFTLDSNGLETGREWGAELDDLARNLLEGGQNIGRVLLVGHTDDVASDEYNIQLGKRRADFVAEQLRARGVPANILEVKTVGEREPLAARSGEDPETYRKRLRRVTVEKILNK